LQRRVSSDQQPTSIHQSNNPTTYYCLQAIADIFEHETHAKKFGRPIVSLKSWNFDTTIPQADSAEQAVAILSDMLT
jgi:hypothetical protein